MMDVSNGSKILRSPIKEQSFSHHLTKKTISSDLLLSPESSPLFHALATNSFLELYLCDFTVTPLSILDRTFMIYIVYDINIACLRRDGVANFSISCPNSSNVSPAFSNLYTIAIPSIRVENGAETLSTTVAHFSTSRIISFSFH